MNHNQKLIIISGITLLLISLIVNLSFAFLESGFEIVPVNACNGRNLGLGRISIASDFSPSALLYNPATLSQIKGYYVSSSFFFNRQESNRSFPVYDNFESLVTYNTYSINSANYSNYSIGIAKTFKIPNNILRSVSVALGTYPLLDFRHNYKEDLRDNAGAGITKYNVVDQKIASNYISSDGILRAYSFGSAIGITKWFNLGFGLHSLNGKVDSKIQTIYDSEAIAKADTIGGKLPPQDLTAQSNMELSGMRFNLGALFNLGERIRVGVAYKPSIEIGKSYKSSFKQGIINEEYSTKSVVFKLPDLYGFGIEYRPRQLLFTNINLDVEITNWSKFEYNTKDTLVYKFEQDTLTIKSRKLKEIISLQNVVEYKAGVEHIFHNKVPARIGFRYSSSYLNNEITSVGVSLGTGFKARLFDISVAGEVENRGYRQYDLFKDSHYNNILTIPVKDRTEKDKVNETYISGIVSVSVEF